VGEATCKVAKCSLTWYIVVIYQGKFEPILQCTCTEKGGLGSVKLFIWAVYCSCFTLRWSVSVRVRGTSTWELLVGESAKETYIMLVASRRQRKPSFWDDHPSFTPRPPLLAFSSTVKCQTLGLEAWERDCTALVMALWHSLLLPSVQGGTRVPAPSPIPRPFIWALGSSWENDLTFSIDKEFQMTVS